MVKIDNRGVPPGFKNLKPGGPPGIGPPGRRRASGSPEKVQFFIFSIINFLEKIGNLKPLHPLHPKDPPPFWVLLKPLTFRKT